MKKEEFCIMPDNPPFWRNHREFGLHRHEVFYGTANRQRSIRDGLVIFLPPELHNMSPKGIHFNREFDIMAKRAAERAWLDHYGKTAEEFIQEYGKNFL